MGYLGRVLGFFWLLPATVVVWLCYIIPFWIMGLIRWDGWYSFLIAKFIVKDYPAHWYFEAWRDWAGWSGPCVILYKPSYYKGSDYGYLWVERTLIHEEKHCTDQFMLGLFFYPAYALHTLYLLLFTDKHSYLDNVFERRARAAAKQPINIPKERWPDGPTDRWPWW